MSRITNADIEKRELLIEEGEEIIEAQKKELAAQYKIVSDVRVANGVLETIIDKLIEKLGQR